MKKFEYYVGNHENGEWHVLDEEYKILSRHKTKAEAYEAVEELLGHSGFESIPIQQPN
jgi:hypothetical protein